MKLDRRTFLTGIAATAAMLLRLIDEAPTVTVEQGQLRGASEGGLNVFRGVPFAKPPVGPLRFLPPEQPDSWSGVRDADRQASIAPQSDGSGSEDCLYLNLWAPKQPGKYPILIWIHGGANEGGGTRGQSGASFARLGIIVVTVPYRLGSFGFLELEDDLGAKYRGSGDNGIRDPEAAIRWVRKNGPAFGGDPAQITIAGQSAGAKDVAALMAAPSARTLFSRAIMESGSGQTVHTPESARDVTEQLLQALALGRGEARRLLDMPTAQILEGQRRLDGSYSQNFPFRPVVGDAYLPKRPVDMLEGAVPLLLGTCRDESLAFFPRADADLPIRSREVSNVPFARIASMADRYEKSFPADSDLDRRVRLLTAEEYWIPSIRFAEAHSRRVGQTWMYRFDRVADESDEAHDGYATHGSELAYVWNEHPGWDMHETWAAFIKGAAPAWPKYDMRHRITLIYGQEGATEVVQDPRREERLLWDGVL